MHACERECAHFSIEEKDREKNEGKASQRIMLWAAYVTAAISYQKLLLDK